MPYAAINGTDLYYESHGEGHPLVLSHGIGSNHLHWWQQIPVLSKHFRVITFDHRGFGFSKDNNDLGPKAFVDDLEALLAHLGVGKAILCGQSMGGATIGGYASRHPDRVTALILSCSGGGFFPVTHSEAFKQAIANVKNYEEFSKVAIEQDNFPTRHPVLRFLFDSMAQLNHSFPMSRLPDMRGRKFSIEPLVHAKVPALLLGGEDDNGANGALRQIHGLLAGSKLHIVPNAGHLLFFEAPETYNKLVLDFLSSH
jgi:3-oxoadipate enol-lactonase